MDLQDIKNILLAIQFADGDDEAQHSLEDKMLWDFVTHISKGVDDSPIELSIMASEILKSKDIKFCRWCA